MGQHLIDTPAEVETCPRCGAPLLVGHWSGLLIRAELANLSSDAEATAIAAGHDTYDLILEGHPRRLYLEQRDPDRPRSRRPYPVVRSHRCARPAPSTLF